MNKILITFLVAVALLAVLFGGAGKALSFVKEQVSYSIERSQIGECEKWQRETELFERYDERFDTGYYILKWQHDQC